LKLITLMHDRQVILQLPYDGFCARCSQLIIGKQPFFVSANFSYLKKKINYKGYFLISTAT